MRGVAGSLILFEYQTGLIRQVPNSFSYRVKATLMSKVEQEKIWIIWHVSGGCGRVIALHSHVLRVATTCTSTT
jgi:hypothetical protein